MGTLHVWCISTSHVYMINKSVHNKQRMMIPGFATLFGRNVYANNDSLLINTGTAYIQ